MPIKDEAARKAYHKEYHAKWYKENKEKRNAQIIEYKKTKPDGWQKAIGRKCHFKKRYNITPQEYEAMLEAQNYKCAICNKKAEDNKRGNRVESLNIDHCHKTKQIRGLLCHQCNSGLGHFKDNTEFLLKAVEYLRKPVL
jgi:hypothetical protein